MVSRVHTLITFIRTNRPYTLPLRALIVRIFLRKRVLERAVGHAKITVINSRGAKVRLRRLRARMRRAVNHPHTIRAHHVAHLAYLVLFIMESPAFSARAVCGCVLVVFTTLQLIVTGQEEE